MLQNREERNGKSEHEESKEEKKNVQGEGSKKDRKLKERSKGSVGKKR